jgi:prophage regulatory protein
MSEHLLRAEEVAKTVGLSRACVWRWAARGQFPRPIHLGPKMARWRSDHVRAWVEHVTAGNPPTWPLPTAAEPAEP